MSDNNDIKELTHWANPLADKEKVTLADYMETYKSRITQDSERLFVTDFYSRYLGKKILSILFLNILFLIQKEEQEE